MKIAFRYTYDNDLATLSLQRPILGPKRPDFPPFSADLMGFPPCEKPVPDRYFLPESKPVNAGIVHLK